MPGWHAKTKQHVANGELTIAGIVQEQHSDRAALYMQWQKMDWPLLADPFNDLAVTAVPITLLIDGHGIIRYKNPSDQDLETFLATEYEKKGQAQKIASHPRDIDSLLKAVKESPKDAAAHFRLGVAYRKRYDSDQRKSIDFASAIDAWETALRLNPNQYIWRRRIQQYGPRLDKPYSFYDWIQQAREDLTARGETPHPLTSEPTGAEFARPVKGDQKAPSPTAPNPDPQNKIILDTQASIKVQTVVVRSTKSGAPAVRVHLSFKPQASVTWTNDAGNISFHLSGDTSAFTVHDLRSPKLPKETSTNEERSIEFEIRPKHGQVLPEKINGAAFYYICTSSDGVCHYLRQNITITLK
ncbi:hypothetical protein NT6N_25970 [Oceaniferula spumae]|uniref:Uncharacterized protein n=1 Tax=Oceaniferula spumae TaxID=2979115 RepID=A0AAT9FNL1_9BACT